MKKAILGFVLLFVFVSLAVAQQDNTKNEGHVILKAGTEFSARLQNDIDAKKAKVPLDIVLRTTADVESLDKNTEVYARVVRAEKTSKENDTSRIGILFDFVKKGNKFLPLDAQVVGVEKNGEGIEFSESPTFEGGTVLSLKGKDIKLEEGTIIRLKLKENLTEN
jgi:hypothetical protein